MNLSIDVYCRVVDNFGDAGICWRLARQLANEHGCTIRLIIDQPEHVLRLYACDEKRPLPSRLANVEVHAWSASPPSNQPPDVVIAAFQCELPDQLATLLNQPKRAGQPLWINLDYLSAEAWVDDAHGLPSHKAAGGIEWFYLPGFTNRSGGLIREHATTSNAAADLSFLPSTRPNALRVSMFCYSGQNLEGLIETWNRAGGESRTSRPIDLLITAGCDLDDIRRQLQLPSDARQVRRGTIEVSLLPWLTQQDYDRLLAQCDLNFVRGEDSWIRAIWTGKPFIWRPYPQNDGFDRAKLDAFLKYCQPDFDPQVFAVLEQVMHAWRDNKGVARLWPKWLEQQTAVVEGFRQMSNRLKAEEDQASRLIAFIKRRLL